MEVDLTHYIPNIDIADKELTRAIVQICHLEEQNEIKNLLELPSAQLNLLLKYFKILHHRFSIRKENEQVNRIFSVKFQFHGGFLQIK